MSNQRHWWSSEWHWKEELGGKLTTGGYVWENGRRCLTPVPLAGVAPWKRCAKHDFLGGPYLLEVPGVLDNGCVNIIQWELDTKGPPEMLWDKKSCLPPPNPLIYLSPEKDSGRWGLDLYFQFSSVQSLSCVRLRPHGLQHTRLPCSSPSPRACSNSCSSSWWCHPNISSSIIPFSSCLQSFPTSESFSMTCI